jgi:hypothetical protein
MMILQNDKGKNRIGGVYLLNFAPQTKQNTNDMKQLLLAIMLLSSVNYSMGHAPGNDGEELKKEIKRSVDYPDFAKAEKLHGLVMVKFKVDSQGAVQVEEINASHDHLGEYVKEQLESIRVEDRGAEGEHFVKFRFRFVDL